jgi:tyrosyl-tRNA synthetase
MLHDVMPGHRRTFDGTNACGVCGIDPTADSLHIGHLVGVML